jgi:N-acetylmuramic acid 6-phosphate etherase
MHELMQRINSEDKTVPLSVEKVLDKIEALAGAASEKIEGRGRMFYVGAGTSGRLGIVDASECPPTFGIEQGTVYRLDSRRRCRHPQGGRFAEDDENGGWKGS